MNDYVLVPDSAALRLTNEVTFELWFKAASPSWGGLFDKRNWGGANYGLIVSPEYGVQLYYDDPDVFGGDHPGNQFEIAAHFPLPSLDEFHHFAGTYRQVDAEHIELKMYIDGGVVESRLFSGNLANTLNSASVAIGGASGVCCYFQGVIDEVALYNRALSASEIQSIYNADSAGKCKTPVPPQITSQPESQTVFLGETATFAVAASGSAPLSYQWQLDGQSLVGATAPALVISSAQTANAGGYTVVVGNAVGAVTSLVATLTVNTNPRVCVPPPAGLVAWWTGDGDANDLVGANHGTLYGAATFAPGKVGQGFAFDGVNAYVLVPDSATLHFNNELTMDLWFKADEWAPDKTYALIDKRNWTSCNYGAVISQPWGVQLYYNDPSVLGGDHPGNIFEIAAHFPLPTAGEFHHFAGTYRQADAEHIELKMYLDGQVVETRSFLGNLANTVNDIALAIGNARAGAGESFKGVIDEVSLYSRALSATEIQAIYGAGSAGKCKTPFPPQITSQPQSQTVFLGETATFAVTASGSAPLSYQWQLDGQSLVGATAPALVVSSAEPANAGGYTVVVGNAVGAVTSIVATLTVNTNLPVCVSPPAGLVAWWTGDGTAEDLLGANPAELRNGASFGPGKVGQGFVLDGVDDYVLVPDSPSLRLTNEVTLELWFKAMSPAWGGLIDKRNWGGANYGLIISADYGVQLYYNDPNVFGGDHPGNMFEIAAHFPLPALNEFHHVAGTYRQVDASHIELKMYLDATLVESRTFSGNLANSLNGASVAIGGVSGSCCYFQGVIDEVSLYNRALSAEEIQAIAAAGTAGKCRIITPTPPQITSQPQSRTVYVGEAATFEVSASGTPPVSYQWQFNGAEISGATDPRLVVPNAQPANVGDYRAVVSNAAGSVTSVVAVLAVNTNPPTCVPPPAGLVAWWTGDGTAGDLVGQNHGELQNGATFAAGKVGQGFKFDGVDDFVLVPHNATLNLTNELTVELWFNSDEWMFDQSYTLIDKRTWTTCNYGVTVSQQWGLQLYYNDPGIYGGDHPGNIFEISAHFPLPTPGAFHHFAGTYRQVDASHVELNTFVDGQLVQTRTFQGNLANTVNDIGLAIGSARAGAGDSFKGMIDEVALYNKALSGSEIQAIFNAGSAGKCKAGIAPRIVHQPADAFVRAGETAIFGVDAVGTQPLGYQWSFNDALIEGATLPSLQIDNVQSANAGSYSVSISNAHGSVVSASVTLTVDTTPITAPSILSQPVSRTVTVGSSIVFNVAAAGTPPLDYQWLFNGIEIGDATQSSLSLNGVQFAQAGNYSVRVSNAAGSVTSTEASLIVELDTNPPAITRQPSSITVPPGSTAAFMVVASGASPLTYQWRFNGSDLPGATNSTLSLANTQFGQAGNYSVVVSNPFGTVVSADAVLTVEETFVPGAVVFANRVGLTNSPGSIDAPVFDSDGITRLDGPNFRAELVAGPTVGTMAAMGPSVEFRTGVAAGYFFGSVRAITNVPAGEVAYVQVRAWDQTTGATYELAQAGGGKYGASPILEVVTGGSGSPPSLPPYLIGLESFSLAQGVAASLAAAVIVPGQKLDDGSQEWILKGQSGFRYVIECSTNLVDWVAFNMVIPVNGTGTFSDPPNGPCTYYRALLLP